MINPVLYGVFVAGEYGQPQPATKIQESLIWFKQIEESSE